MSIFCENCIGEICDHCRWYDFDGDKEGGHRRNGYCRLHKEAQDPDYPCLQFYCRNADPGNRYTTIQPHALGHMQDLK